MGTHSMLVQSQKQGAMMQKQIDEQNAELKQKRTALFSDELETLKSSGQAHLDTQSSTDNQSSTSEVF